MSLIKRNVLLSALTAATLLIASSAAQAEMVLNRGNGAEPETLDPAKSTGVVVVQPSAVSFEKWPLWAKAMALMKKEEDKGVGDTVYRVIGLPASEAFKKWYARIFGKSCGCTQRQQRWNQQYRY